VPRLGPLDLIALGAGAAAAALGIAAGTGPFLVGLAVAVAIARVVRARTAPHEVIWLVVPLLVWIGSDAGSRRRALFLAGVACLLFQAALAALAARGRPEAPTDVEVAARVTLAVAAGVTAISLLAFGNIYL
jgi:hypothetical protein